MKYILLVRHKIGSDAREGNRHLVEVLDVCIWKRDTIENELYLLPRVEALRKLNSSFDSELDIAGVGNGILFAAERQVLEGDLATKNPVLVDGLH